MIYPSIVIITPNGCYSLEVVLRWSWHHAWMYSNTVTHASQLERKNTPIGYDITVRLANDNEDSATPHSTRTFRPTSAPTEGS